MRSAGQVRPVYTINAFALYAPCSLQKGAMMQYTARLVVLGVLSITYLSSQARKWINTVRTPTRLIIKTTYTVHAEAQQMIFCFRGFTGGTCSGDLLGGGAVNSPQECCFSPDREENPGLGGGAYVISGDETCFSCMTVIGESVTHAILFVKVKFNIWQSNNTFRCVSVYQRSIGAKGRTWTSRKCHRRTCKSVIRYSGIYS